MHRRPLVAVVAAAALITTACAGGLSHAGDVTVVQPRVTDSSPGTSPSTGSATTAASHSTTPGESSTSAPSRSPLSWTACKTGTLQCATVDVPLDYRAPSKGHVTLALERRAANDTKRPIGSLLVDPGGPGAAGTVLVDAADQVYSQALLDRFDIVGWDPRGTGQSHAVVCVDDNDPYVSLDPTPNSPAAQAALEKAGEDLAAKCQARSGDILPYVSTEASARDMDVIRQALGEAKISYFGFSYGSQLGATWATLFPATVRAGVLDGSIDPNDTVAQQSITQAQGFEQALNHFLADCAQKTTCPFRNGGNPAGAYDALVAKLDASPLPGPTGRPPINEGVTEIGAVSALYSQDLWPILAQALADAQHGDGAGLLALYDQYRIEYGPHTLEGLLAISCLDDGPVPADQRAAVNAQIAKVAPHFQFQGDDAFTIACEHWPVPPAAKLAITAKGAGPIVVVGTTGDPATPLESTRGMAKALEQGRLVVDQAEGHTGYRPGSCVGSIVDKYLTTLAVPVDGTTCTT